MSSVSPPVDVGRAGDQSISSAGGAAPSASGPRSRAAAVARSALQRGGPQLLIAIIALIMLWAGMSLRAWAWEVSEPVRFRHDISNAWNQGSAVLRDAATGLASREGGDAARMRPGEHLPLDAVFAAWVRRYERVEQRARNGRYSLDYTPLRLGVMTLWMWHVRAVEPRAREYDDRWTDPLLHLNSALCAVAAVAAYFIVLVWLSRSMPAHAAAHASGRATRGDDEVARQAGGVSSAGRSDIDHTGGARADNIPTGGAPAGLDPRNLGPRPINPRDTDGRSGRWGRVVSAGWQALTGIRARALLAAALVWFNPAVILNAHCWPQWDVWVLPFFMLAVLAALRSHYLTSGMLIAVGAMLKGQILLASPVILGLALAAGGMPHRGPLAALGIASRATLRWAAGLCLGVALTTWPFLLHVTDATGVEPLFSRSSVMLVWTWAVAGGTLALASRVRFRGIELVWVGVLPMLMWPWVMDQGQDAVGVKWLLLAATLLVLGGMTAVDWIARPIPVVAPPGRLPRRGPDQVPGRFPTGVTGSLTPGWPGPDTKTPPAPVAAAGRSAKPWRLAVTRDSWFRRIATAVLVFAAVGVFAAALRYDGSFAWYRVGFEFPTRNYERPVMGPTSNLSSILQNRFDFRLYDPLLWLPWVSRDNPWTLQTTLRAGYFTLLALVTAAAAWHARRRDPALLAAVTAPWVLFFALLPQMHERYLIWGATIGAIMAVLSAWHFLVWLLVLALGTGMIWHQLLREDHAFAPGWLRFYDSVYVDLSWLVLLAAAMCLVVSLTPVRPRRLVPPVA